MSFRRAGGGHGRRSSPLDLGPQPDSLAPRSAEGGGELGLARDARRQPAGVGRERAAIAPEPAYRPRRDPSRDRHRARRQQPRRVLLRARDPGRTADRARRLQGRERRDEASSGALPRLRTRRRRAGRARAHRARRDDRVDRAPRQQEGGLVPVRDGARHPRGCAHLATQPRLAAVAPRAGDRPRAAPSVGTGFRRRAVRHRHLPGPDRVPGRAPHRPGRAPARPRRPRPLVLSQRSSRSRPSPTTTAGRTTRPTAR